MMLRRVSDQARSEGVRALHRALDGVRGHAFQRSVPERARREIAPAITDDHAPADEMTKALNRIADTIERVSVQLEAHQQERAEHFDAIEFLMREMVIGTAMPSLARPTVRGGVIDPPAVDDLRAEINLSDHESPLEVDTSVEVRSRFHDRWICGFTISEVVGGPDRYRYRLTRRSDGIPLPLLFDGFDVRATATRSAWPRTSN
jgi:hypothetical protein